MPDLTATERELLRDVIEGVALAVARSGEIDRASRNKIGDTKLEKFVYKGLEANGYLQEITHSWYIAGAKADTGDEAFGTAGLKSAFARVDEGPNISDEFVDERRSYSPNERVREFAEYFQSRYEITEKWFTNSESFLLDFYRAEAPDSYRDLYVAVQKLRNVMSETDRTLYRIRSSTDANTSLTDFTESDGVSGPDRYDEVRNLVSQIHIELSKDEVLEQTLSAYREYTDLLEDVYLAFRENRVERIDDAQIRAFKQLRRQHFYEAWRLPALAISRQTSEGPRAENLRFRRARELAEHEQNLRDTTEEMRRTCAEAALVPTVEDYPDRDPDTERQIEQLLRTYTGRE